MSTHEARAFTLNSPTSHPSTGPMTVACLGFQRHLAYLYVVYLQPGYNLRCLQQWAQINVLGARI